jgi:hypothetical protein
MAIYFVGLAAKNIGFSGRAAVADALHQQVDFARVITLRQFDQRDLDVQALCLATPRALKVDMIVVMHFSSTGIVAKRVFQAALIKYFVD